MTLILSQATERWVRTPADARAVEEGCRFDLKAAVRVRDFFARFLRHSKGEWAGKPFDLLPWQWDDLVAPLFGWLRPDGTRRFRAAYVEIAKKNGKALAWDTPIPTPSGWSRMIDLAPGDRVFGADGVPCTVVATSEVMLGHDCYRVRFSDGSEVVADAGHLWETHYRATHGGALTATAVVRERGPSGASRYEHVGVHATEQLAATLDGHVGRNHRVMVPAPLSLPDADLPVPPYVLGCWLGDGDTRSARFTCSYADAAVVEHIEACGVPVGGGKSGCTATTGRYLLGGAGRGGSPAKRAASLQAKLRAMGLLYNKHIPAAYLRASQPQRLELLRGLMDTDGYVSAAGQCEFTTTLPRLAAEVYELIRTLGFKATVYEKRATLRGRDCGPKFRIQFWAFSDTPVFRLPRKAARLKAGPVVMRRARSRSVQVVAVERVESVPVRCIRVDSPRGLFLAGRSMVPTHNSALASAVGLYLLAGDKEAGAEVYSVAADRDQAGIVHGEAVRMVEASAPLLRHLVVNYSTKNITFPGTKSWYKALSSEAGTKEGFNAHGLIIDELHAWPGRALWDALRYAGRARRQPLRFAITTAGDDPHSICREQHDYAKAVLRGEVLDTRFFAYIRAARQTAEGDAVDDDWRDPEAWRRANPSMGATIREDDFAADVAEAERSPVTQSTFKRYSLNVWSASTSPWLRPEDWAACRAEPFGDLWGRECFGGLDLAKTQDMTALALLFPDGQGGFDLRAWFWLPESRAHEPGAPAHYRVWAEQGLLELTPGEVCDYAHVKRRVAEIAAAHDLRELAYDPYNAEQLTQELEAECGIRRISFGQTVANFASPTAEFERLVLSRKIRHDGNAVLAWQAGHVQVRSDANNNRRPVKPRPHDPRKIDGIVAAVMALARASLAPAVTAGGIDFWD